MNDEFAPCFPCTVIFNVSTKFVFELANLMLAIRDYYSLCITCVESIAIIAGYPAYYDFLDSTTSKTKRAAELPW